MSQNLDRRDFLRMAGGASLALSAQPAAASRPNIVYVFGDQHRNSSWSGGDDPQVITPNLARMAREGVTFDRCITNYPLCSPYRASLLTGRYPQTNTVMSNLGARSEGLPATEVTIADLLKKAGYATGYVGKWHLDPQGNKLVPPGPRRHGFDWWRVCHNYRSRYDTRCYDDNGKEFVLPEYAPKSQMDMTIEFIEKNAARPFCVFLSWHPPHAPYPEAPQRFADMYPLEKLKLRPNVPKDADLQAIRKDYQGYFSHVTALDEEMGRLMQKLAALGIAQNTIVCYSSDHGDMLGSFNLWAKQKPWEESINVPFVVRWPSGIPGGKRVKRLFSTVDIAPTLLGLAGVSAPSRMEGADVSGVLRGKDAPGPESAFIMARGATATGRGAGKRKVETEWRGVRTERYTYAKFNTGRGWVLYDNEKDPYQMQNLIDDASASGTRKELDGMVGRWQKRLGEA